MPSNTAFRRGLLALVGGVISLGLIARLVQAADAQVDQSQKLEEVVVTAQKRSESLQVVPISAQVISGAVLAEQNHNSLEELTQTVPGVHIANSSGFSNDL